MMADSTPATEHGVESGALMLSADATVCCPELVESAGPSQGELDQRTRGYSGVPYERF